MDAEPLRAAEPAGRLDLAGLDLDDLERALEGEGEARFRAGQIFRWIHKRGVPSFERMTDLSRDLRAGLSENYAILEPGIEGREKSADGTEKFLLRVGSGHLIEAVFIPELDRSTLCISTQAGCAVKCAFCLTGRMGLVRNLSAGEIAGQVRVLARDLGLLESRFTIVLMGMGEPLNNYDATMKAIRILAEPRGMGVGPRRVTLSTVGLLPGLERLRNEKVMPNLAVSLHATTDEMRARLVPIARAYPLERLIEACRNFPLDRRRRITFEYVLLDGVNDTPDDAKRLARLLSGIKAKVNLIPLNAAPGIPFERPSDERVDGFASILAGRGFTVSVRKSRGRDIRAACGQLIVDAPTRQASPAQALASRM